MPSDRARVSYDEARQWRSVISQQGRVRLEADDNEAWQIAGEEQRKQLIELVGPRGTPDDGWSVIETGQASTPAFDLHVGPGTMYVGGMRVEAPDEIVYSDQDEWLDHDGDADWRDPTKAAGPQADELIYLALREQEVGAVEDPALREVALGGPDTGQRARLVKRIKRLGVSADTCAAGVKQAVAAWGAQGLRFDARTLRLTPAATLKVGFATPAGTTGPCDPVAGGGYLHADNQLIRVQVTEWNDAAGTGKLLWGYDNSSFMYRATVVSSTLIELLQRPPDDAHQPRSGDAIEVLRPAVALDGHAFVAAPTGAVFTLTSSYVPETHRITLPSALVGPYPVSTAQAPPYFVRVWKQELPFTAGTAVTLGSSGMTVTLASGGRPIPAGTSWCFAVRPSAPGEVFPERFLQAGQPPIGPRMWACPLAVVRFTGGVLEVLDDCREHFDDLVTLTKRPTGGGCECTACVTETSHASGTFTIQDAVDQVRPTGGTVCLAPGRYVLDAPVRIEEARGLRLRGQGWRTELVQSSLPAAIEVRNSVAVAIERLLVRGLPAGGGPVPLAAVGSSALVAPRGMAGMGILVSNCLEVDVTECAIVHAPTPDGTSLDDPNLWLVAETAKTSAGVGIALDALCLGHRFTRNLIAARAGIGPLATGEGEDRSSGDYLVAGRVLIDDNVIVCHRFGVRLQGSTMFVDATRVERNTIYGCWEGAGVELLGRPGVLEKRSGGIMLASAIRFAGDGDAANGVDVIGNVLCSAGDGVVSSVAGTRVRGNRISGLGESLPGRGVALVRTEGVDTLDHAEVRENRIAGVLGPGVVLDTELRSCTVTGNQIEEVAAAGILVTPDGRVDRLVVSANEVTRVAVQDPDQPTAVYGILVQLAGELVADGNAVRQVGAGPSLDVPRTGIKLKAVDSARLSGNAVELLDVEEYGGPGVGIDVVGPWDRLILAGNTVTRRRVPLGGDTLSFFIAVRINGDLRREQVEVPDLDLVDNEVVVLKPEDLVTDAQELFKEVGRFRLGIQPLSIGPVSVSFAAEAAPGAGVEADPWHLVLPPAAVVGLVTIDAVPGGRALVNLAGNILDAETALLGETSPGACIEISGAGRCIVAHNHCTVAPGSTAMAIARVDALSLIATGNDLDGPPGMEALHMDNTKTHTVLGNIAPGKISNTPFGVDAKWINLNLV